MLVQVTIGTLEQTFAGGTVGGDWRIELTRPADPNTIAFEYEGAAPSTTFDLPEGDTFNARGVRLDAAGVNLGPVATAQFTVGADLVPLDVANSITVASQPGTPTRGAPQESARGIRR